MIGAEDLSQVSKIILGFLFIFILFYAGIDTFRKLSRKEKLDLTKSVFYSIMCASAAIGSIALIVFLF
jgi:preprotein translocase subunit SecE